MTHKGVLICLTGIDGAGKTTLAKSLTESMKAKDIDAIYVYNRFKPVLMRIVFLIGKPLFLRKQNIFKDYKKYSTSKKSLFRHPGVLLFYRFMVFFEYSIQVILKTNFRLARGKVLVCDRYIYDTIINDFAIDLGYSQDKVLKELKWYFRLFPSPDLAFFVDIPEEVAMQRKNDIPSIDFIRARRRFFLETAARLKLLRLNGCEEKSVICSKAETKILSYIKMRKSENE